LNTHSAEVLPTGGGYQPQPHRGRIQQTQGGSHPALRQTTENGATPQGTQTILLGVQTRE